MLAKVSIRRFSILHIFEKLDTLSQEVQNLRARIELDRQVIN